MADQESFVSNAAESTLSSSLAQAATTANVTSTSGFPAVPFYAVVDPGDDSKREVVRATAKTATSLTITRGEDNTSDVAHDSGAVIAVVPVAALWTDINDRVDAHEGDFDGDHGSDHDSRDHSAALGTASLADLGTANGSDLDDLGTFLANVEVDGSTEVATASMTGSYASLATVNLTIPAPWNGWKCYVVAALNATGSSDLDFRISIDGTAQQALESMGIGSTTLVGHRTGMTTTGSRTISLQGKTNTAGGDAVDITLYARAVRTS